jgi:hypothetical protein
MIPSFAILRFPLLSTKVQIFAGKSLFFTHNKPHQIEFEMKQSGRQPLVVLTSILLALAIPAFGGRRGLRLRKISQDASSETPTDYLERRVPPISRKTKKKRKSKSESSPRGLKDSFNTSKKKKSERSGNDSKRGSKLTFGSSSPTPSPTCLECDDLPIVKTSEFAVRRRHISSGHTRSVRRVVLTAGTVVLGFLLLLLFISVR